MMLDESLNLNVNKEEKKYKFSRFNTIIDCGEEYILYNSFTGALGIFNHFEYRKVVGFIKDNTPINQDLLNNLIHCRFIVNENIDELQEFRVAQWLQKFRTENLSLVILPTKECNFRCIYCYENFENISMSKDVQDALIKFVGNKGKGIENLSVGWFGGEPLLTIDIIRNLSENFIELSEKLNFNYSSHISTNGFLLTPEIAETLLKYKINSFQITLDGPSEIHNQRRKNRDGSPTFEKILDNLIALKNIEKDFKVSLRVHFDNRSKERVIDLLDMLAFYFANDRKFYVYFRSIWETPSCRNGRIETCSVKEESEMIFSFYNTALARDLNILIFGFRPKFYYCYAEHVNNYVIRPDGYIAGCTVELDREKCVGRIKNDGTIDFFLNKRSQWFSKDAFDDQYCRKCRLLPVCGGGCQNLRLNQGRRECFPEKYTFKELLLFLRNNRQKIEKIRLE